MTDAEKTELLHWMSRVFGTLVFLVIVILVLVGVVLWALYERREEAERDAERVREVKRIAWREFEKNLAMGRPAAILASILIATGEDRNEIRTLFARGIKRTAEMFAEPRPEEPDLDDPRR